MPYDNSQVYVKFQTESTTTDSGCSSCGSSSSSSCSCDDKCSCCPPGLVAIYNDENIHTGCLTPNDAELYTASSYVCEDGYIRLVNAAGDFLGCVSQTEFAALYQLVNP